MKFFWILILLAAYSLSASDDQGGVPMIVNEVLKPFSAEAKSFVGGEIYEHYKGKLYRILSVGRNSETLEESIVYQALYGDQDVWIRPLSMFLETIVIDGEPQPRFKRVE
jgi:hypothetical protein